MNTWKRTIRSIPLIPQIYRRLKSALLAVRSSNSVFLQTYPPGHYYSPIPDLARACEGGELNAGQQSKECPGIDLREAAQIDLLDKFAAYYEELPFPLQSSDSRRYYYENSFFSYADAIVLFGILRHFQPSAVIEVGSGFSSAAMLDTKDAFLRDRTQFTFIEPYPDRLNELLNEQDKYHCTIIDKPLQEVELALFATLGANDILFIDSSHVVKVGSDVTRLLFEILPSLRRGVIVHFHDILWPFEYPKEWLIAGRAWNEAYVLRAFLQYNNSFEIIYFNAFMDVFHRERLKDKMPLCLHASSYGLTRGASSLWLQKTT